MNHINVTAADRAEHAIACAAEIAAAGPDAAPSAERIILTHCAACGKGLSDPFSVESGIGPICRGKHGLEGATEEDRQTLRGLIAEAARPLKECSAERALSIADSVEAAGFPALAQRMRKRFAKKAEREAAAKAKAEEKARKKALWEARRKAVRVEPESFIVTHRSGRRTLSGRSGFGVYTPYLEEEAERAAFTSAIKALGAKGGRNLEGKFRWWLPESQREALWGVLKAHFGGRGMTCNGADIPAA